MPKVRISQNGASVLRALLVLIVPITEFIAMRVAVRRGLGIKLGWESFTDYDLIFPVPVAFVVAFLILERNQPLKLRFSPLSLTVNLLGLFLFGAVNFYFDPLAATSAAFFVLLWSALAVMTLLSGLTIFAPIEFFLRNANRWVWFPAVLIALSTVLSRMLFDWAWPAIARLSTPHLCNWIGMVASPVSCLFTELGGARIVLRSPEFSASLGQGCGGTDVLWLFAALFTIAVTLEPQRRSFSNWVLFGLLGLSFAFFLNLTRITSFFLLAITFSRWARFAQYKPAILMLFHTHAGWILYCVGFLVYFRIADSWLSEAPKPLPSRVPPQLEAHQ